MDFKLHLLVLVCAPLFVLTQDLTVSGNYPCDLHHDCRTHEVCRLMQVTCFKSPCPVLPTCVRYQPTSYVCARGQPVVGTSGQPITCRIGRNCPTNTTCTGSGIGQSNKCCWSPPDTKPVLPPKRAKPGNCPNTTGMISTCVDICSNDKSCAGNLKCCSNGCGHVCMIPVNTTNPCKTARCPPGTECKVRQAQCIRAPCDVSPVAECVRVVPGQCRLPPARGLCKGRFRLWYYNSRTSRCGRFVFGGCGGNANRFTTAESCYSKCDQAANPCVNSSCGGKCLIKSDRLCDHGTCNQRAECESIKPRCMASPDRGSCEAFMPSWFYNSTSARCEKFVYGGCHGNDNRFPTAELCYRQCNETASPCVRAKCGSSQTCLVVADGRCSRGHCRQRATCVCPMYKCRVCQTGYVVDESGCQTCQCRPTTTTPGFVKPGQCPALKGKRGCDVTCNGDGDCPGDLKCCYRGCGRGCMEPINLPSTPTPAKCPRGVPAFMCKWFQTLVEVFRNMFKNMNK